MSNSNLFLKSGFIRAPLQNGLGRCINQLQRITIKFCKNHGGSRGMRDFIENQLVDFAKFNPSVVVYVKPRRHRSPVLVAEYRKFALISRHKFIQVISSRFFSERRPLMDVGTQQNLRRDWKVDEPQAIAERRHLIDALSQAVANRDAVDSRSLDSTHTPKSTKQPRHVPGKNAWRNSLQRTERNWEAAGTCQGAVDSSTTRYATSHKRRVASHLISLLE